MVKAGSLPVRLHHPAMIKTSSGNLMTAVSPNDDVMQKGYFFNSHRRRDALSE